jgi:hypothetical protein
MKSEDSLTDHCIRCQYVDASPTGQVSNCDFFPCIFVQLLSLGMEVFQNVLYLPKSNLCMELSLCLKAIVLILQILVPLDDTLGNSFTPPKGSCNADSVLMPSISRLPASQAVAMDCEMVGGGKDGSVDLCARVCLVDEYESVLLDTYVQPFLPVTDYRHVFF